MVGIRIREGKLSDISAIINMPGNDILFETCKNKVEIEFVHEKLRLHITHPSSRVLTAWLDNELIGFLIYTIDERKFKNFIKSPKILSRIALRMIFGFYGYNPLNLGRFIRRFLRRLRQPYGEGVFPLPNAFLVAYATHLNFRKKGVASALLAYFLQEAKANGVKEIGAWVGIDNEPSLLALQKFGFEIKGKCFSSSPMFLLVRKL
ncbi:MAG: GNAT family N-acetyltransferase [bacterium]